MGTDPIIQHLTESLWIGGLAATPLAIVVGCICRWKALRPATRHMLWFAVLASFVTPAIGAWVWTPHWFRSERLIAAADSVLASRGDTNPAPAITHRPANREIPVDPDASPSTSQLQEFPDSVMQPSTDVAPLRFDVPLDCEIASGQMTLATPVTPDRFEIRAEPSKLPLPAVQANKPALPGQSLKAEPSTDEVRVWLVRLLSVRDAFAALPPVPAAIWLGGALLMIALRVTRTIQARLWISRATPADPEVQAAVRRMGDALGLSCPPRAVFVEEAVSPMIWCGLRPVLVLPVDLWQTLDEDSRRAVLAHELAHIRRWDHIVCWFESVIGAVYWWHPIVWWARHRLRDEAESSCDAWVTSLFPSGRRAYASALVVTGSYLSTRSVSRGPWLGVASTSSRRLARRITMVMTQKAAPRLSRIGACVAALVVTTGTFVMPGLACPPEKAKSTHESTHASKHKSKHEKVETTEAPDVTFFGEAPALEAMRGHGPGAAPPAQPTPPAEPRAPNAPRPPKGPRGAAAPLPFGVTLTSDLAPVAINIENLKDGRSPRDYSMSPGKLEAFAGFMSRNDVPVLIEMHRNHIVIWANDDEHAVFERFVSIVGAAGDESVSIGTPSPLARAGRADHARQALEDLVRAREQMQVDADRTRDEADAVRDRSEELRDLADTIRERAQDLKQSDARRELDKAMNALETQSDALEEATSSMEERVSELERQIELMEEQIEQLEAQIEAAMDTEESMDHEAPEAEGGAFWDATPEPAEPAEAPSTTEPAC